MRSENAGFHAFSTCSATIPRIQQPIARRAALSEGITPRSHQPMASPTKVAGSKLHTGFQLACFMKAG